MEYTSFHEFSKKYWWLYLSLSFILIIAITIFCMVFKENLGDASAWASMIAGIATYIGSSFLGVVVFYNSWIQVKIQEKNSEISLYLNPCANIENGYFVPYKEKEIDKIKYKNSFQVTAKSTANLKGVEFQYLELGVINQTNTFPINLQIEGLYFVNDKNRVEKIETYSVISDFSLQNRMDYKQEATIFLGASNDILNTDYYKKHSYLNFFVVLKVSTITEQIQYYIVDYVLGHTLGISKKILSKKQYEKRCENGKMPIVLTNYNKQFFKTTLKKS